MAFCAGGGCQILSMTIAAGGTFVIYPTLVINRWMRTVITGIPVAGVVALGAIVSKHSLVEPRISVAACAEGRRTFESPAVAALTGEVGVASC